MSNGIKFWAARYGRMVGPYENREAAVAAFMKEFPKSVEHKQSVLTGYGNYGPHFDVRWHTLGEEK